MLIETGGVLRSTGRVFKTNARYRRQRWNNESPFRLSKEKLKIHGPYITIPLPKNSPMHDVFYPIMLRLQAGDIFEQVGRMYYYDYFDEAIKRELEPLAIGHLLTGMYGCIIGLVLAVIAFAVETLKKRKRNKKVLNTKIEIIKINNYSRLCLIRADRGWPKNTD